MKSILIAFLFIIWMFITLILVLSMIGLMIVMTEDTWMNLGRTMLDQLDTRQ